MDPGRAGAWVGRMKASGMTGYPTREVAWYGPMRPVDSLDLSAGGGTEETRSLLGP